jgi:DNA helicase-2/ATP-dependent DNA helicase PcrA
VHRVAKLVNDGVNPERILLLTFTRKAAQEMLSRASTILDERCTKISGGTFHSFAHTALRRYAKHIGYTHEFTILDRSDSEDLVQSIRKDMGLSKSDKRFPKKNTLLSLISKSINTSKSIKTIISEDYPQFMSYENDILKIAIAYHTQKRDMNVMDYDDLLVRFLELLQNNPDIQESFKQYYEYIMVDEYQDTNLIQATIIQNITNNKENILVVGDDSQSIYSFRGAHYENIMKFPNLYPRTKLIKLEQNYRSTQPILDLTNALIAKAKNSYSKILFSEKKGDNKPVLVECESDNAQSKFICKKVLELREQGVELKQIAVLIRSGWHSNDLEIELKSHAIPFVKVGGFKFVESSHIKDLLSYFRVLYNTRDEISWTRILMLCEGCGAVAAKKISTALRQGANLDILNKHKNKKYSKELERLILFINNKALIDAKPKDSLETILTLYSPLFKLKYDDYHKRQSDLDSFAKIIERYETLQNLVSEMTLDPPTSLESNASTTENENLCLSTIHSAKGLEWHTVFVLSAIDGYIPSFQSLGDLAQLEEERRLLYVALTRAENNLFIMKPNIDVTRQQSYSFSGIGLSEVSRFLNEGGMMNHLVDKKVVGDTRKSQSRFSLPGNYENNSDIFSEPSSDLLEDNRYSKRRSYYL